MKQLHWFQKSVLLFVATILFSNIGNSPLFSQTITIPSSPTPPATYRVLNASPIRHHSNNTEITAVLQQKNPAPYSYGWFGASQSGQWSRQLGYSRSYINWNRK
ncbi:hypothetical protein SH449x_004382 [Pirellulaceae bacterium SH449]